MFFAHFNPMDRFFIHDFFAFLQEKSCRNGFLIEFWKRCIPQAWRHSHDPPGAIGHSPFSGVRYFGN
jgi:hypothetical protein